MTGRPVGPRTAAALLMARDARRDARVAAVTACVRPPLPEAPDPDAVRRALATSLAARYAVRRAAETVRASYRTQSVRAAGKGAGERP